MIELAPNNAYGLALQSPVVSSAGCFGYGVEYVRLIDMNLLGGIVTRSTSLQGRRANEQPFIRETPAGVLSAGTWPNPGLEYVLRRYASVWAAWSAPVILSLVGSSPQEYAQAAAALEGVEGIAAVELCIVDEPRRTAAITAAVRKATLLPVVVKLPIYDDAALDEVSRAAAAAGADALTVSAWTPGLDIDLSTGVHTLGRLSGPALLPQALRMVAKVAEAVDIPVIGGGGITSTNDARRFLAAGAVAVQIGAALLANPWLAIEIGQDLTRSSAA